jgi:hypothetical protein
VASRFKTARGEIACGRGIMQKAGWREREKRERETEPERESKRQRERKREMSVRAVEYVAEIGV